MKITKFVHSCLLVETPERVAIFDPGMMSKDAFNFDILNRLDDIFITHMHGDHMDPEFISQLIAKFPTVTITAPQDAVEELARQGIKASTSLPAGVALFDSPHESVQPMFPAPQEYGYHFLDVLSDPGDSHSFTETKSILALPVQAPWGSSVRAMNLALELQPKHVLPIHDWHWRDEARAQMYSRFEEVLGEKGITFHKLETGQPVEIDPNS
ncbi:MAG TPA: MBL fold metallo-hydrolase [Candidatus Saccharimonadales bacterium]|nr:MBL fold metallo-hydrolase [Candidatus Saccharimonadales bacterium]